MSAADRNPSGFITLPIYTLDEKSNRFELFAAKRSPIENDEMFSALADVAKMLGELFNCNISIYPVQPEPILFPPSPPTLLQYLIDLPNIRTPEFLEEEDQIDNSSGRTKFLFCIHIHGPIRKAEALRNILVRIMPTKLTSLIRAPSKLLLNNKGELRQFIKLQFAEIVEHTCTDVVFKGLIPPTPVTTFPTFHSDHFGIEISGHRESVILARMQTQLLLTRMQGYQTEEFQLERKYIPSLAGKKHAYIQSIMATTNTIIYLPSTYLSHQGVSLNELNMLASPSSFTSMYGTIIICGKRPEDIQNAKQRILKRVEELAPHLHSCQIRLGCSIKRDWLLKTHLDYLVDLMYRSATYIAFPPLGFPETEVTIYGIEEVYVTKTAHTLFRLLREFFVARIHLRPKQSTSSEFTLFSSLASNSSFFTKLGQISTLHGTEIRYDRNSITVHGPYKPLFFTCFEISRIKELNSFSLHLRFEAELDSEQKEFFLGKKAGKIRNILRWTASTIKVNIPNTLFPKAKNLHIILNAPTFIDGLRAFELMRRELPSELYFHVPEPWHRRVIGSRGSNIQQMTSIHKLYVRFSNTSEHASRGGYEGNEDNVVLRTPAKFYQYLVSFKREVFSYYPSFASPSAPGPFVVPEITWHSISIPVHYHSALLSFLPMLRDNENIILVEIPPREYGTDNIAIFGTRGCIPIIHRFLELHICLSLPLGIPASDKALALIQQPMFLRFSQYLNETLGVDVILTQTPDVNTLFFMLRSMHPSIQQANNLIISETQFFTFLQEHRVTLELPTTATLPDVPPPQNT